MVWMMNLHLSDQTCHTVEEEAIYVSAMICLLMTHVISWSLNSGSRRQALHQQLRYPSTDNAFHDKPLNNSDHPALPVIDSLAAISRT